MSKSPENMICFFKRGDQNEEYPQKQACRPISHTAAEDLLMPGKPSLQGGYRVALHPAKSPSSSAAAVTALGVAVVKTDLPIFYGACRVAGSGATGR